MFTATKECLKKARGYIATARAYKRTFPQIALSYLQAAEKQLAMAELYIK